MKMNLPSGHFGAHKDATFHCVFSENGMEMECDGPCSISVSREMFEHFCNVGYNPGETHAKTKHITDVPEDIKRFMARKD